MKKALLFLLLALAPALAQAQTPPPSKQAVVTYYAGNPFGACSGYQRLWWNTTSNVLWFCEGGTWISVLGAAAGTSFPLLAPAGAVTAPSYSFSGSAEMGMWRSGTNLLLQNKGVSPGTGRSRVTFGEENFSLSAVRTENATHSGAIQCFDEASSTMKCRVDVFDGTNTNTTKTEPTFTSFNKALRAPEGLANAGYAFTPNSSSGLFYDSSGVQIRSGGVIRDYQSAGSRAINDNSTTPFFQVGLESKQVMTVAIDYSIEADNDTDMQVIGGTAHVSIYNNNGTEVCSTITELGEVSAMSAGTITATLTCDTSPTDAVIFEILSDSSLTAASMYITYRLRITSAGAGAVSVQ